MAHFAGDAWAIVADPPDDLDVRPHRPELLVSASVIPVAVRSERESDADPECRRRRKHLIGLDRIDAGANLSDLVHN